METCVGLIYNHHTYLSSRLANPYIIIRLIPTPLTPTSKPVHERTAEFHSYRLCLYESVFAESIGLVVSGSYIQALDVLGYSMSMREDL